jgi:hypothetical protein
MPTFTAPPCSSTVNSAMNFDAGYATATPDTTLYTPSSTTDATTQSLITPPPYLNSSDSPAIDKGVSKSCYSRWLCIDYVAFCGESTQIYGA